MSPAMTLALVFLAVLALAFANGANDNFKGVATLHGSGRIPYRRALYWATITTLAGSAAAIVLGSHLAATFSGTGIVPAGLVADPRLALSVASGAALAVLLATRFGLPISTTHALVGGLCGSGLVLAGSETNLGQLGRVAVLPLLLSPLAACFLTYMAYRTLRRIRLALGINKDSCICVVQEKAVVTSSAYPLRTQATIGVLPPIVAHRAGCRARHTGTVVGINAQTALDSTHFLSTGIVSFARGLNDTPKIVAILTGGAILKIEYSVVLVAVTMAIGGLVFARRVGLTMSQGISPMNDGQGLSANLVTAGLVLSASWLAMPVSTTHVAVGSIFGIGAATGGGRKKAIARILLAWVITLPLAGFIAAITAQLVR